MNSSFTTRLTGFNRFQSSQVSHFTSALAKFNKQTTHKRGNCRCDYATCNIEFVAAIVD